MRWFPLSWPLIFAMLIGWNFLFGDDEDTMTIKGIEDQSSVVLVDNQKDPTLQEKLKNVGIKLKNVGEDIISIVIEELETTTEGDETNVQTQDIEEEKETVISEGEEIAVEEDLELPTPTEEKNQESKTGMKKL
jgi:hypothetical protein